MPLLLSLPLSLLIHPPPSPLLQTTMLSPPHFHLVLILFQDWNLVVNPYKTLANVNNVSAKEYEERCYMDTFLPMLDSHRPLQPHLYNLAARVYLLMRRRNESQAVVTRFVFLLSSFAFTDI